jgi:hypothetical protein
MSIKFVNSLKLIVAIIAVSSTFNSFSQGVEEVYSFLQQSRHPEKERIVQLINGVNPTLYLVDGESNLIGGVLPVNVQIDPQGFAQLPKLAESCSAVELLELRISSPGDLKAISFDDNLFTNWDKLKCVLVRSSFQIKEADVKAMFEKMRRQNLTFLYQVVLSN